MLVSQMLSYVRVLLTAAWCQGAQARDEQGQPVEPWDLMAISWSVTGAVKAVASDAGDEDGELERHASNALALVLEIPSEDLSAWNDDPSRVHRDALSLCDCAIELVPQLVARHLVGSGR